MSRMQIKEFCHAILADNRYPKLIPEWCKRKLANIDIEFTRDNIDIGLKQLYCNVLHEEINIGRVVSMLGFADVLCQRYSWCNVNILIDILTDVLTEAQFNPNSIKL